MKVLHAVSLAALLFGSVSTLTAQDKGQGQGKSRGPLAFEVMDSNGDKALTKDELQSHPQLNAQFDSIDTDKSGAISQTELQTFRTSRQATRMNQ